jgi:hypothetical protein
MANIRIARTGLPALAFDGELLAESGGKVAAGKEQNRWHSLALYRTAGGRYVATVEYHTQWQGELDHTVAEEIGLESVADWFRGYNPTSHCQGFPRSPAYAERQAHLEGWLRQRYEDAVGTLLSAVEALDERLE